MSVPNVLSSRSDPPASVRIVLTVLPSWAVVETAVMPPARLSVEPKPLVAVLNVIRPLPVIVKELLPLIVPA